MDINQALLATCVWAILISIVYTHTKWSEIIRVYKMWFTREYWTDYNIIEALSWLTKALIIVPGLIFGIQVWWFYFLGQRIFEKKLNKFLIFQKAVYDICWSNHSATLFCCVNETSIELWDLSKST